MYQTVSSMIMKTIIVILDKLGFQKVLSLWVPKQLTEE